MILETAKILDPQIKITATTVRVPVTTGHSESLNIETEKSFEIEKIKTLLAASPGIELEDDPESLAMEMSQSNPNLQIHCVHPGHIGTNIAADARMDEEEFNKQLEEQEKLPSIFTRNAPKSLEEMGNPFGIIFEY